MSAPKARASCAALSTAGSAFASASFTATSMRRMFFTADSPFDRLRHWRHDSSADEGAPYAPARSDCAKLRKETNEQPEPGVSAGPPFGGAHRRIGSSRQCRFDGDAEPAG